MIKDSKGQYKWRERFVEHISNRFKAVKMPGGKYGKHATMKCHTRNLPGEASCESKKGAFNGKPNCCLWACGPFIDTTKDEQNYFGGYPSMWDKAATTIPKHRPIALTTQYGSLMCKVPKKMGAGEHILRIHACYGEAKPLCVRLKVTTGTKPFVMGWAEVVPAIQTNFVDMMSKEACKKSYQETYGAYAVKMCAMYKAALRIEANADNKIREAMNELRFEIAQEAAKKEETTMGESSTEDEGVGRRGGGRKGRGRRGGLGGMAGFMLSAGSNTAGNDEAMLGDGVGGVERWPPIPAAAPGIPAIPVLSEKTSSTFQLGDAATVFKKSAEKDEEDL